MVLSAAIGDSHWMYKKDALDVLFNMDYRNSMIGIMKKYYAFNSCLDKYLNDAFEDVLFPFLKGGRVLGVSTRTEDRILYESNKKEKAAIYGFPKCPTID